MSKKEDEYLKAITTPVSMPMILKSLPDSDPIRLAIRITKMCLSGEIKTYCQQSKETWPMYYREPIFPSIGMWAKSFRRDKKARRVKGRGLTDAD